MTDLYRLRYRHDTADGLKFPSIRYPGRKGVPRQTAELMRAAMPHPDDFEIVKDGE